MSRRVLLILALLASLSPALRAQESAPRDTANWDPDPNRTRLFFTPTARPLEKGEGYVSSYFLFFPMVAYGVTDRLTIAGGTPLFPGLTGEIWYLAPKLTLLDQGRTSFAVGALGFFGPKVFNAGSTGVLYGAGTYGSKDNAVTLGAGWGYYKTDEESAISNRPVFVIGGERRVGRNVKLVTENWLGFNGGVSGFATGGVRFISGRLSADLGLGGVIGEPEDGCCFPLVNFVWTFGNRPR